MINQSHEDGSHETNLRSLVVDLISESAFGFDLLVSHVPVAEEAIASRGLVQPLLVVEALPPGLLVRLAHSHDRIVVTDGFVLVAWV